MNRRSMHPTPHRLTGAVAAATLAWASAACGNVTVGGFTEVTVDVSGNAPTAAPSPQPALLAGAAGLSTSPSAGPLPTSHEEEEAEGEVEVDFTLALLSESGDVVPLGRDDIRIKLDLQGVDEAEAVKELVPTAHYTELRITFTHIKVEVHAGLVIDGQEITGEIEVELEDPELVVGRPVDLEAIEGSRVELLVDLNTPAWLGAVDPATRTIDASVFAGLIDLVVR